MTILFYTVFTLQFLSALVLVTLVLLQQGKGAEFGASASSEAPAFTTARGSTNLLSRFTQWAGAIFFATTLGLSLLSAIAPLETKSVLAGVSTAAPAPQTAPATPGGAHASK